jgi:hypothetical protein
MASKAITNMVIKKKSLLVNWSQGLLSNYQRGFRHSRSSVDHLITLEKQASLPN